MIKAIKNSWQSVLSISVLLFAVFLSLGLFFSKFDGGLSGIHSNWGDFGSFISGTIGVVAACLAVVWLIISVHLQKVELARLKMELKQSANEQKKQTHISALTALVNSCQQAIVGHHNDLIARKNGVELEVMASDTDLRMAMDSEWKKLKFYEVQLEQYLNEQYHDPYAASRAQQEEKLPF